MNGKRLFIIRTMAEAVAAVHKAGYIHRDVCPRNFMVSPQFDRVTLIDFGLTLPAKPEFMQPGNRTGTPNYMSPEIVRRRKTDQRLDVFAFGVTAYEVMTFELPWPAATTGGRRWTHDLHPPVDIREYRPKINEQLAKAIMWCLAAKSRGSLPQHGALLTGDHGHKARRCSLTFRRTGTSQAASETFGCLNFGRLLRGALYATYVHNSREFPS